MTRTSAEWRELTLAAGTADAELGTQTESPTREIVPLGRLAAYLAARWADAGEA